MCFQDPKPQNKERRVEGVGSLREASLIGPPRHLPDSLISP